MQQQGSMTGGAPPPAPDSQDVMNQVLNQYFEEGEPASLITRGKVVGGFLNVRYFSIKNLSLIYMKNYADGLAARL